MIALDTNVLLRLVARDDPQQARAADRVFAHARGERTPLYLADAVLCEFAWVLRSQFRRARGEIAKTLRELQATELIVVEDPVVLARAIAEYAAGRGDFADYVIRERAMAAGAAEVVTFDRDLRGEAGFRVIGG